MRKLKTDMSNAIKFNKSPVHPRELEATKSKSMNQKVFLDSIDV